ncbi:hypothetical protein AAMO2058_001474000 [Amorphochlora amoebiformis]
MSREQKIRMLISALRKQVLFRISAQDIRDGRLEEARKAFRDQGTRHKSPLETSGEVDVFPTSGAPIGSEWITPVNGNIERVIIYAHGGGFVAGAATTHRGVAGDLALGANAAVMNVDYRLAPEHPFPAGMRDIQESIRWLTGTIGVPNTAISVAGESAGASICLSALIDPKIKVGGLVLMSTFLSLLPNTGEFKGSLETNRDFDYLSPESLSVFGELYGVHSKSRLHSHIPQGGGGRERGLRIEERLVVTPHDEGWECPDLRHLPNVLIQAGNSEILADDSRYLAAELDTQGVKVTLDMYPNMFHAFQLFPRFVEEAELAIDRASSFIVNCTPSHTAVPRFASQILAQRMF